MFMSYPNSTHEKYTETYQHWCPQSEKFAGGDHFISAVRSGWSLKQQAIHAGRDWKSGSRPVTVYYFILVRDDETMMMPVISNPFIERYLVEHKFTIIYQRDENLVEIP